MCCKRCTHPPPSSSTPLSSPCVCACEWMHCEPCPAFVPVKCSGKVRCGLVCVRWGEGSPAPPGCRKEGPACHRSPKEVTQKCQYTPKVVQTSWASLWPDFKLVGCFIFSLSRFVFFFSFFSLFFLCDKSLCRLRYMYECELMWWLSDHTVIYDGVLMNSVPPHFWLSPLSLVKPVLNHLDAFGFLACEKMVPLATHVHSRYGRNILMAS